MTPGKSIKPKVWISEEQSPLYYTIEKLTEVDTYVEHHRFLVWEILKAMDFWAWETL